MKGPLASMSPPRSERFFSSGLGTIALVLIAILLIGSLTFTLQRERQRALQEAEATLTQERYAEMSAHEDLILTVTARGAGKLSSAHDYPVRGRGGQGVMAMDKGMRGGPLIASFPVTRDDQIMLATSTGQSIRVPVDGISFRSRSAGGVRVLNTAEGEEVVSVARVADQSDGNGGPEIETVENEG